MGNPQTITLNGRQYDALSGKMLGDSDVHTNNSAKSRSAQRPKNIDGFIGHVKKKGTVDRKPIALHPTKSDKHIKTKEHKVAPHVKRTTERSKTLMRSVVHRPESTSKDTVRIKSPSHYRERLSTAVASGVVAAQPAKEALAARAQAIQKSNLVTKFGELTTPPPKTIEPDPKQIQTTANSEVHLKKLDALAQQEASGDAINMDVFEEAALKLANSYQSLKRKHTPFYEKIANKLHLSNLGLFITSIILLVVIAAGIVAYVNMNNIEAYMATERTGVHTTIPSYTPAGFSLSHITYYTASGSTGSISLVYTSNSDKRNYSITEQTSTTDSQGLVDSVIEATVGSNYQTYQVGGRTVYFYQQYAVWVDSGIYYRLTNNAGLTNDQMIQIINNI